MSKMQKFQLIGVKIVWSVLLILLFYNFLDNNKIEHYFLTAATFVMLIHIWWGTIFYIKHIGPTRNFLEFPIDISIVGLLVMAVFSLELIVKWFIIFGTFFAIVILKYLMGLSKTKNPRVRTYIKKKIKYESPVVFLLFLGAVVGAVFEYSWIPRLLSILIFFAQIPFIYLLVFKKKVYNIPYD